MSKFLILFLLISLPVAKAEEKEISIEDFLQNLSSVPGVVLRRDPFVELKNPYKNSDFSEAMMSAPIMERYPLDSYRVIATLIGDKYPRALIKVTGGTVDKADQNRVLIMRERDKLGNRGGIINQITRDGVMILQSKKSNLGFVDKALVKLLVGKEKAESEDDEEKK